jgi:hypothetical protein
MQELTSSTTAHASFLRIARTLICGSAYKRVGDNSSLWIAVRSSAVIFEWDWVLGKHASLLWNTGIRGAHVAVVTNDRSVDAT